MDPKNIGQSNTALNGQSRLETSQKSFQNKHNSMSFICKKTEKIATAIYMVTDFVYEREPLRHELRTLALGLIGNTRKISARSSEPDSRYLEDVRTDIDHIKLLLGMAATIGIISEMNATIIETELSKLKGDFEGLYGIPKAHVVTHPGYANIVLSPELFNVEFSPETILPPFSKGHDYKGQTEIKDVLYKKDTSFYQTQTLEPRKKTDPETRNIRREDVLNIIRKKGRASIKDISSILTNMSEKTIQRELLSLVREGRLKKEGEKRWSTYIEDITAFG